MIRPRILAVAAAFSLTLASGCGSADTTLLNVSYDPTRELYHAVNEAFIKDWKAKTGETIIMIKRMGLGKQARAVIDGLQADIVTLALQATSTKSPRPADQRRLAEAARQQFVALHVDDRILVRHGNPRDQGLGRSH